MTWHIRRTAGQWAVIETATGEQAGRHDDREAANRQLRELWMASIADERAAEEGED